MIFDNACYMLLLLHLIDHWDMESDKNLQIEACQKRVYFVMSMYLLFLAAYCASAVGFIHRLSLAF